MAETTIILEKPKPTYQDVVIAGLMAVVIRPTICFLFYGILRAHLPVLLPEIDWAGWLLIVVIKEWV